MPNSSETKTFGTPARLTTLTVTPTDCDLYPAAAGMVVLELRFRWTLATGTLPITLNFVRGDLYLGTSAVRHIDLLSTMHPARADEGRPALLQPPLGQSRGDGDFHFRAHLQAHQVKAIEERRQRPGGDGDCEFSVELHFEFVNEEGRRSLDRFPKLVCVVDQSAWIRKLNGTGFSQTRLLEVPKLVSTDPRFAEANRLLADAEKSALDREWKTAVRQGRDVLEVLKGILGDESQPMPEPRLRTREQRLRDLRGSASRLSHLASHADEMAAQITWTSDDAYGFLQILAGVLRMLSAKP